MKSFLLAVLSGILIGTSWPPFWGWALPFAFVPLLWVWGETRSMKRTFLLGWVTQIVLTAIGFHWISHVAREFGHIHPILSYLVLIGYCAYSNLQVVLAGVTAQFIRKRYRLTTREFYFTAALLYPFFEWVYPQIFPWNMGFPLLYSHFYSAQLAEFIGFWGLGLVVLLVNAWIAMLILDRREKHSVLGSIAALFAFLIALEGVGFLTVHRLPDPDRALKILATQPNVGNFEKAYAERGEGYQDVITNDLLAQTNQELQKLPEKPDLIVWPETSYPAALDTEYEHELYAQRLKIFARHNQISVLTGAYSDERQGRRMSSYNAVFLFDENGELLSRYRKTILLAFGEYMPGAKYFPWLKTLVPEVSDFDSGSGPTTFNFHGVKLGIQICYEGLETLFVRDIAALGAHIHMNLTNDSWFGRISEPEQHMIMTMARSVETRRPVLRVTNTGYTTAFDPRGEMLFKGPLFEPWTHFFELGYYSEPRTTIYMKIAAFLPWLVLIVVGIVAGRANRRLRL